LVVSIVMRVVSMPEIKRLKIIVALTNLRKFPPQVVPLPQPLSCGIYRVLDALHVGAFASIDVQSPVCFEHPVYLVFDLDVRHMLAAWESPDFL
jgi:hypothetical protein